MVNIDDEKVLLRNGEEEALKVMALGLKLAIEGRARLKRVSNSFLLIFTNIIVFLLLLTIY